MDYLAIELPGGRRVNPPAQLPRGGLTTLVKAINIVINLLLVFAIVYTLFMIIWAAILWTSSSGEKQNLEKARSKIKYALIGFAFCLGSFAIMALLSQLFGVPLLTIGS